MLEDQLRLRQSIMDSNQYDGGETIGRSATGMFVFNPLIDSLAINSYGKNNFAVEKFNTALKTKVYNNHTMLTGTSFGDRWGKIFKIKETSKVAESQFKNKWNFNFLKSKNIGATSGLGDEVSENVIRTGFGFSRNHSSLINVLDDLSLKTITTSMEKPLGSGTIGGKGRSFVAPGSGRRMSQSKSAEYVKVTKEKITKLTDTFGAGNVDEGFELMTKTLSADPNNLIKAQRAASKAGIKTVINTADDFANNPQLLQEGAEKLSGLIRSKYFTSTAFEKFMGSDTMMLLTGAGNAAGKIGLAANIGGAVISAISATHQESMVQSSINMGTFNLIKGEDSLNHRSTEAIYSNQSRSTSNDQDLNYVLRTANNAEQYRSGASPISIDRTKSSMNNFTLY